MILSVTSVALTATVASAAGGLLVDPTPTTATSVAAPSVVAPQELPHAPGLVRIPGGRYEVGASEEFIVGLVEANESYGNTLSSELGGKPTQMPEFCIMPTEVTNEQYAAFVRATGHRPPQSWADPEALRAAVSEHNSKQAERIKAAREAGQTPPAREEFNVSAWYDANADDIEWQIPSGQEGHPVTWINHADAKSYAAWAGLRLMTEFEFQVAGRGKSQNPYPWGEAWEKGRSASLSSHRSMIQPVGSVDYATELGIHDLIGNVWEWTDSPYVAYERFKPLEMEFGSGKRKRKVTFAPEFDANNRVAVGGSVDFDELANHLTVRRNTDRTQRTEKLGFRCAATPGPAVDRMTTVIDDLRANQRPSRDLAPEYGIALQRWQASEGTVDVNGYAVIEDYQYLAIAPVEKLEIRNMTELTNESLREGPVGVGILSTSVDLVEPPLPAGNYLISWRGKGEDRSEKDEEEVVEEEEEVLPYDINEVNLLISNAAGEIVAIYDGSDVDVKKLDGDNPYGRLDLIPYVAPTDPEEAAATTPLDTIDVTLDIPSRQNKKVVRFVFGFRLAEGAIDESWVGMAQG